MNARLRAAARVAFVAALAMTTWLLLSPRLPEPVVATRFPWQDLVSHVVLFATLGALLALGWSGRPAWLYAALVAYGAATEVTQAFVPERTATSTDFAADALGALMVFLVSRALSRTATGP